MADERAVLDALLKKKPKYILVVWHEFKKNKVALAGAIVVIALLVTAFGAELIMPSSVATAQDIRARFVAPGPLVAKTTPVCPVALA